MPTGTDSEVVVDRNVLIPLHDGVRLAGDLFRPADVGRYPTLVSYYPYHKDDVIGSRLDHPNRYFARRGYAVLLVDFRGLGSSEGIRWEHMDPREGEDGAEIVEWAAAQPWSDGNVGMWGMSYGGASTLYAASNRPAHLRAAVAVAGDVDIYHEINYPGGCLIGGGILSNWGPWMVAMGLLPPLSQDEDGRWYRLWRERLDRGEPPHVFPLQEHPDYDEFWQEKRVRVEEIQTPTFLIGAWRDQNPNAMIGAFERIRAPKKLIIGPWMHSWPDLAPFDPVDYLLEMDRWWKAWLHDEPDGIRDEPPVTIYVQGSGWRHEAGWPVPAKTEARYLDLGGRLSQAPAAAGSVEYRGDPTLGIAAGLFDPAGTGLGLPVDQGPDDHRSITFTSEAIPSDLEITGTPAATLRLVVDEGDDIQFVVKLCDVAADGGSKLITTGWLKGSHWRSHEAAEAIPIGEAITVTVPLMTTSYLVRAGQRLRVSVSCSDFPRILPSRSIPLLRLACGQGGSVIELPLGASAGVDGPALPEPASDEERNPLSIESSPRYEVQYDFANDTITVISGQLTSLITPTRDGRLEMDRSSRSIVHATEPGSARVEGEAILTAQTSGGNTVVAEGRAYVTNHGQTFSGRASIDGLVVFEKRWTR